MIIWTTLFLSLLFFQQAGSMPEGATWAGSQWNHVWVSPQLLKNSFTTSGQQDSNPLPSIFDSQHRNFGCLKWLVKMVKSPKNFVSGYSFSSNPEGEWKNCQRVLKFLPLIFGSETSKQVKWVRNVRVDYPLNDSVAYLPRENMMIVMPSLAKSCNGYKSIIGGADISEIQEIQI